MKGVAVNFVMIGLRYAFRRLDYVPRVGEFVTLNTPKNGPRDFEVTRVTYDIADENENHWQIYAFIKEKLTTAPDKERR